MKLNGIIYHSLAMMGLLALTTLFSFTTFDNCSVAATNVSFIKDQTKLALDSEDHQISKYHAYKALNAIWSAKASFSECGCTDLIDNMALTSANLKEATKAQNRSDAMAFLKIALQNALVSAAVIEDFILNRDNKYFKTQSREEVSIEGQTNIVFETEKIEAALEKFEASLNRVVEIDDCDRAYQFVRAMQQDTKAKLMNKDVTQRKHYYLTRVVQITDNALYKLGKECMPIASLAGK